MNKKLFGLLGLSVMAGAAMVGTGRSVVKEVGATDVENEEIVLFENGEYADGVNTDRSYCSIVDKNLVLTYSSGWQNLGLYFSAAKDFSDAISITVNATKVTEGTLTVGLATYGGSDWQAKGVKGTWGAASSTFIVEDLETFDQTAYNCPFTAGTASASNIIGVLLRNDGNAATTMSFSKVSITVAKEAKPIPSETEAIFADGAWNTEITGAVTYGGDATPSINGDGELVFTGWSTPRALFANPVDLTKYEKLEVTFTAGGWANAGFMIPFGTSGDKIGMYDAGSTLAAGKWEMPMDAELYTGSKSMWGTTATGEEVVDFANVVGFSFKSSNSIKISSIVGVLPSAPAVVETDIFTDGAWNTEVTGAVTYGGSTTPSINASNELEFTGWSTPRALFTNAVDFTQYNKVVVTVTAGGYAEIGPMNNYGGSGDKIGAYKAETLPVGDFELNLDGSLYTGSKTMWGTTVDPTIPADFTKVVGLSFKSSSVIKISKIVAVKGEEPEPEYEEEIPEGTEFDFIKNETTAFDVTTIKGSVLTELISKGGDDVYPEIEFANDSLMRQQLESNHNLSEAYYQSGILHFSLKNEEADSIIFRLFSGNGGDMPAIQFEVENLYKDGEFHDYVMNLSDLPTWTNFSSWTEPTEEFDMSKSVVFDYRNISGFGIQVHENESEGEEDTIKVGVDNVYVDFTPSSKVMTGIKVSKDPTKKSYTEGEKFVATGMQIKAVFDDLSETTVMPIKISAPKAITKDENEVSIRFTHGTQTVYATYEALISELQSIEITTAPTKLSYVAGEKIDLSGMVVEAYDGIETKEVPLNAVSLSAKYAQESAGTQTITVSYGGKTDTFDINVAKYDAYKFNYVDETYYNATGDALVGDSYKFEPAGSAVLANSEATIAMANNWTAYRYSADFKVNVSQIYNETDGVSTLRFAYKTEDLASIKLGLGNVQTNYDTYYRFVEVDLENDGEEHVAVVRLDAFDGEYNGAAWSPNTVPASGGEVDFSKISSVAFIPVSSSALGSLTVKSIGFAWAEEELSVKIVDTWGPSVIADETLQTEVNAHYGDEVDVDALLAKVSVYDGTDSVLGRTITKVFEWSEGALDANGKLNAGDHTLTIYAVDASGNKTDVDKRIVIDYHVAVDAVGIEIDTSAVKLTYEQGDEFSSANLGVKVVFEDGSKEDADVAGCEISGYDMSVAGEQTVTVKLGEFTATFKIVVNEKAPEPHVHTFAEDWTSDDNQHWHAATCGHDVKDGLADHVDANGDGKCDVCGKELPKEPEPVEPQKEDKGCGGSIIASSVIVASVSLIGASLLISKKRKEDK